MPGISPERMRTLLLVAVVVISGVVVWTVFNPTPHSGGDNSGYVGLAHGLLTDGEYADVYDPERLPHTKYPPLFPALLDHYVTLEGSESFIGQLAESLREIADGDRHAVSAEQRTSNPAFVAFLVILLLLVKKK